MPLAPHRQLILSCCQVGESADERLLELAVGPLDWRRLVAETRRLELAPLVAWRLERLAAKTVPARPLARLREIYRRNLGRNLHLAEELGEVLDLFEAAEIPAIPLKGPVLAETVYGHPGLRRIYDLDVLVQRSDLERAVDLLRHSGYRSATPKLLAGLEGERDVSLARSAVVELHWALKDRFFHLPVDALWAASVETAWHGRKIRTLPPELLLLQLIHHLNYHAHPLKILVDVARVIALHGETIDWARVAGLALEWHLQRNVRLALE
ncbi:MAG: nucleotidyltransferase family protein, partial [Thermoanaerobaculia bacterium]|nr:nucleotidyltransferase family protein [Thermoanaerobaculia bacterium]